MKLFSLAAAAASIVLAVSVTASRSNHVQAEQNTNGTCWSEMQSAMTRMHQGMGDVRPSSDCDENFIRLMIPHHRAAIDMAKSELLYGKDPAMRRLAQEIITSQQSEIELMRLRLEKRKNEGQKRPETGGPP